MSGKKADKMAITNKVLAKKMGCTPRQISKSRKRGYILVDGAKKKYRAPSAVHL